MKKPRKKLIGYLLLSIALSVFGAAVIIYPERYVNCCFQGFAMWAECVLPSLFPFMIVTLIFVKTGIAERAALPLARVTKKIKMPSAAAPCFVLSVCSGYPAGSRTVSEFCARGSLNSNDCQKLACLCSTSGPLFVVGSVGFKMFGDKIIGVKILIAHVAAVLIISVILSLFSKSAPASAQKPAKRSGNLIYDVFYGAVISVAVAGGFIAFFFVAAQFAADFKLTYPINALLNIFLDGQTSSAVSSGIIEATTGCRLLAANQNTVSIALAGFLITFGGLSIQLQQLSYLMPIGVKPLKFIAVKFIQAVFCFLILLLIAG